MTQNLTASDKDGIDEIVAILDGWRSCLIAEVPIDGLLSRCPVAYKWRAPFRCIVVREALLRRMLDLGDGIVLLAQRRQHIAARILLRCAVEAAALLEYVAQRMDAVVKGHIGWAQFEQVTKRFAIGPRISGDVEAIQILNAVRDADKEYKGLRDLHETLSETLHPNFDGVLGCYVVMDPTEYVARLGDYSEARYGQALVPYAAFVFRIFESSYNTHWLCAIESLEQWLRDNDERLEQLMPDQD